MGKTMAQISFDYNKAKQQASNLDNIATQLRTNRSKVQSCKNNVAAAWKGENATKYLRKLETVSNNLDKIEANIKKLASTVRANAKRTYDTEVAAINTAKTRKY